MTASRGGPMLVVLAGGRARRYGGCKPLAPVGVGGEAVIDLVAGDALAAGFETVVLVVNPDTGPAIRYRVATTWPKDLDIRFALQRQPLGTVHAVLAATEQLVEGAPFGVANADDIYGQEALATLANHLKEGDGENALVGFRLRNSVVSDAPVTRGVCSMEDGWLTSIDERRQVHPDHFGAFLADDGREPAHVDGDELVSVNLWGFGPTMPKVLEATMAAAQSAGQTSEVLLPEMVGDLLSGRGADVASTRERRFRVLPTASRCIGVTHPDDLQAVQAELSTQVANGERPASPWTAVA